MGFESFRIELRGGQANYPKVREAIRKHPHVKLDLQSPQIKGSTFNVVDDGRHVIEIELKDTPVRVSCRFTLCHPPSVDAAFLDLVHELMSRFGMEAWICDDVRPEDARPFSLTHFPDFSSVALPSIAVRRAEWIAGFGMEQLPPQRMKFMSGSFFLSVSRLLCDLRRSEDEEPHSLH